MTERHGGSLEDPTPISPPRTLTRPQTGEFRIHDTEEAAINRTPTKPIEPTLGGTYEFDLADGENAARFFELVAQLLRKNRRIRISVE